ncbi:MAG TPA: hypothetical protein VFN53_06355 [Acidobacteriaceae bacterium]|nr:hypothetical protein [Acidobacteriaceae bacterium]
MTPIPKDSKIGIGGKIDLLSEQVDSVASQLKTHSTEVAELNLRVSTLLTRLFGGEGTENSKARLPQLERQSDSYEPRIRRLENFMVRGGTVAILMEIIWQLFIHAKH